MKGKKRQAIISKIGSLVSKGSSRFLEIKANAEERSSNLVEKGLNVVKELQAKRDQKVVKKALKAVEDLPAHYFNSELTPDDLDQLIHLVEEEATSGLNAKYYMKLKEKLEKLKG